MIYKFIISFLGLPAYEAVGIALASDVPASTIILNRATGVVLAMLGIAILTVNYAIFKEALIYSLPSQQ